MAPTSAVLLSLVLLHGAFSLSVADLNIKLNESTGAYQIYIAGKVTCSQTRPKQCLVNCAIVILQVSSG